MDSPTTTVVSPIDDWLPLGVACDLLDVSASTLRRWAAAGRIASRRTAGGHRRFEARAIQRLAADRLVADGLVPGYAASTGHSAGTGRNSGAGHAAMPMAAGWLATAGPVAGSATPDIAEWHARLAHGPAGEQMRGLGQRLLGLLIQYLVWPGDDSRFLADSREVGTRYGLAARQAGMGVLDTTQAFLYFRRSVWRMALQLPSVAQATDAPALVQIAERIERFMDGVLLSTIAGYEQSPPDNSAGAGA